MKNAVMKSILSHPLFAELDPQLLSEAINRGCSRTKSFADGDTIFSPASSAHVAGILIDGSAAVLTPDPTHPTLLRYLHAGELFGITNLFSGEAFISVVEARAPSEVCFLTDRTVRELMERDPAFLDRYLVFLSGRIRFLNRKIGYLTAGSAERRLALYLASYDRDEIRLTESISALSELLDVGRASLYRAFDRLTADGHLQKTGRTLRLLDRDALLRAYQ